MKSGAKNTGGDGVTVSQGNMEEDICGPDNLLLRTAGKRHIKEIKK